MINLIDDQMDVALLTEFKIHCLSLSGNSFIDNHWWCCSNRSTDKAGGGERSSFTSPLLHLYWLWVRVNCISGPGYQVWLWLSGWQTQVREMLKESVSGNCVSWGNVLDRNYRKGGSCYVSGYIWWERDSADGNYLLVLLILRID